MTLIKLVMGLNNEQKELIKTTINNFDCEGVASLMRVMGHQWYDSLEEEMYYPTAKDIRRQAIILLQSVISKYNFSVENNSHIENVYTDSVGRLLAMFTYSENLSISYVAYTS